ncbi:hypothetical protein [Azospirillum sp. SYSU D00513]|uniref:hypothetical protein n=1 Tax=Azospirillum sp. SYSU D00513 TaxID=2812561 RepID=UPI001A975A7B|nr:hypothetical protein [Azospirillum sp. SYSU D00513]
MRRVASGWSWLLAVGASLAVSAPAAAYSLSDQGFLAPGPSAGQDGDQELICFQDGSIIVSFLSEADLRIERAPDRRRHGGLWNGSSGVTSGAEAGKKTACFTSGTNRGGFFSG